MKKRIMMMSCAWLMAMAAVKADTYPYLVFQKTDGTAVTVEAESAEMMFSDGKLVVSSGSQSCEISVAELKSMYFSQSATTGVEPAEAGLGQEEKHVYTVSGVSLGAYTDLGDFTKGAPSGVYVVKSKEKTYKIMVK